MRSNIVKSRENLLAIDTKFHEAEASDASSKPPTVLHLVVLEDDKVLLESLQSAVRQHNIVLLFVEREDKFQVYSLLQIKVHSSKLSSHGSIGSFLPRYVTR